MQLFPQGAIENVVMINSEFSLPHLMYIEHISPEKPGVNLIKVVC